MVEALSGYSQTARDAIRAQMIAYMKRHKIGVPTLVARMEEATGRSQNVISLKTLQNFLAGKRRTNDGFVKICDAFVRKTEDIDQGLALGYALGGFFGEANAAGAGAPLSAGLPGTYDGMGSPGSDGVLAPYGTLTIEPPAHGSFVPVREEVLNDGRAGVPVLRDLAPRRAYRGYGVMTGEILFVLTRNVLTGTARTSWLAGDERFLTGRIIEAIPFMPPERALDLGDVQVTYQRNDAQGL